MVDPFVVGTMFSEAKKINNSTSTINVKGKVTLHSLCHGSSSYTKEKSLMRSSKQFTVTLLPTLLCLVAMLLAACGSSAPPSTGNGPASPDKQVLRWPIGATDFGTFDPALVQLAVDANTLQTVFTGLVEF